MEIEITSIISDLSSGIVDRRQFSASVAEIGGDAGRRTWRQSLSVSPEYFPTLSDDECEALREHFRQYGAWESGEINAWNRETLGAMLLQEVANEWSLIEDADIYTCEELRELTENEGGRIYPDQDVDIFAPGVRWFFYVGM